MSLVIDNNSSMVGLKIAANIAVLTLLSGCQSFYMEPGKTYGEIKVGNPRVTTRERLVNDRLEEDAWLEKQLSEIDKQDFSGHQGLSDVRSLTGVSAQAGVNRDPGQIAIYQSQQKQQLQELQQKAEIDKLNYQITLARKQNELAAVTSDPTKASSTDGYSPSTTASNSLTAPTVSDAQKALDESLAKLNNAMPDPTRIEATKAKSSPIDQFRDKLAYREEIRNEKLQNALDDSHDLHNNTLYRLNFDTTIIPANDTSAWAMINVKIEPPENAEPTPEQFAKIVNTKIADTSRSIANAIKQVPTCRDIKITAANINAITSDVAQCLQDEKLNNVLGYFPLVKNKLPSAPAQNKLFIYRPEPDKPKQNQLEDIAKAILLHGKSECNTGQCSLAILVNNFVAEYLVLLQLNNPSDFTYEITNDVPAPPAPTLAGHFMCGSTLCTETASAGRLKGFKYNKDTYRIFPIADNDQDAIATTFMELYDVPESDAQRTKLKDSTNGFCEKQKIRLEHISFIGATPKESVQRISDVLARRNATELALALKDVTGSASLNTMLSYFNQSDGLFEALRRQPLVVGYTDTDSFGWLIGPKYRIEHKYNIFLGDKSQAGYRHVPIQNGVSGTISVPVFWNSINLTIGKYWQPEDSVTTKKASFSNEDGKTSGDISVNLPARLLLAYDLFKTDLGGRPPILDDELSPSYTVTQGDTASLSILGENLWRSTAVILGGQPADKIAILPDMKGIVANFEKVQSTGFIKEGDDAPNVDLLVVTAEGSKRIGKVKILKASEKKADTAKWEIVGNPLIHPTSELTLKPDAATLSGYAKIELDLLTNTKQNGAVTAGNVLSTDSAISFDSKNFIVAIPKGFSGNGLTDGGEYQARVKVYKTPKDANPTMQSMGSIIYYANPDSSKIESKFDQGKKTVSLTFPKKFEIAYPELKNKSAVKVNLKYKDSQDRDQSSENATCTIASNKCTISVELPIKSITAAVIEDGTDKYPKIK